MQRLWGQSDEMTKMTIPLFSKDENEMLAMSSLPQVVLQVSIDAGSQILVLNLRLLK